MALTTRNRFSRFIAALSESAVPSRDCHVGRWSPRNDKPLVFAILTAACANRLCSAGRGMPLPYNGGYHETAAGTGRQCLPEIATSAVGLLAMTNSGASRHKINAVNAASLHKP